MTTWKSKIDEDDEDDEDGSVREMMYKAHEDQEMLGLWKLRRVGILFSRQKGGTDSHDIWVFLVFFEPSHSGESANGTGDNEPELVFPHRVVDVNTDNPNVFHESNRVAYCYDRDDDIKDFISYIVENLADEGPGFLKHLAEEIFWGWGTFLKEMRGKILNV